MSTSPAGRWFHRHPPLRNAMDVHEEQLSAGQRMADVLTARLGSWPFVVLQSALLAAWILVNLAWAAVGRAWDPFPFILLNLVLSFQAAYTGPIVLMSQNRQAQRDRAIVQHDLEVTVRAEEEIEVVLRHLVHHDRMLERILEKLDERKE